MRPIRRASLAEATPRGVRFDCGGGLACRISFLLPDLVRVIYLADGRPIAPRTWMVPAYGAADVPVEGRDRLDESAWPESEHKLSSLGGTVVLVTRALRLTIALDPFALSFALPDGRV